MARSIAGRGSAAAAIPRTAIRDALFDPERLRRIVPGATAVQSRGAGRFAARLRFVVGPFSSAYDIEIAVRPAADPFEFVISGASAGTLGRGGATGHVRLGIRAGQTVIDWRYGGQIAGAVGWAPAGLLSRTAQSFCARFFDNLVDDLTRHAAAA